MTAFARARETCAVLAVGGALALSACDELPNARILNNMGAPVTVVERAAGEGAQRIELAPGEMTQRVVAYGNGWAFDVLSGGCRYRYEFPKMGVNYPWRTADDAEPDYSRGYPVRLQLEPDHRVYLMPSGARIAQTRAQLDPIQDQGFPLKPLSRTCD
ncbi:MAG: hypothetical protein GC203_23320 [Phenylobacterium sp.]|uniref:hypothetical protein n=1 Tax=Phenylobacterium sp. TaxID=1871053 RepID=UPI0025F5352B|nr:hypothetical protein [Phenylobacterium sp.]MBI1200806.1 hypothetical protein [Phenylobacterium sp.]